MSKTYHLTTAKKIAYLVIAIICTLLIVTIPFAIPMYLLAFKARLTLSSEGLFISWMWGRTIRWQDFETFTLSSSSGGLAGAAFVGTILRYKVKGKKGFGNIPIHAFENPAEALDEIQRCSGIRFEQWRGVSPTTEKHHTETRYS